MSTPRLRETGECQEVRQLFKGHPAGKTKQTKKYQKYF